jgi:hypothetical protein
MNGMLLTKNCTDANFVRLLMWQLQFPISIVIKPIADLASLLKLPISKPIIIIMYNRNGETARLDG